MKLPDSWKSYVKCNCKQKHLFWFLSLSTPCISHFHSYTLFFAPKSPAFLIWFPVFPHHFLQIPILIPCIPHIPTMIPGVFTLIPFILNLVSCIHTIMAPTILPTAFPDSPFQRLQMTAENDIWRSLKTLSASWRSSHWIILQRKQIFRIAVL